MLYFFADPHRSFVLCYEYKRSALALPGDPTERLPHLVFDRLISLMLSRSVCPPFYGLFNFSLRLTWSVPARLSGLFSVITWPNLISFSSLVMDLAGCSMLLLAIIFWPTSYCLLSVSTRMLNSEHSRLFLILIFLSLEANSMFVSVID